MSRVGGRSGGTTSFAEAAETSIKPEVISVGMWNDPGWDVLDKDAEPLADDEDDGAGRPPGRRA
ncbi:MAG TPA: hypothetical protein VD948_02395 [Rhodothermales bacterium]|nr:hypothetical protein [Rhodothermales bacterium]